MTAASTQTGTLIGDLCAALGAERVRAEPTELGLYRRDASMITGDAALRMAARSLDISSASGSGLRVRQSRRAKKFSG